MEIDMIQWIKEHLDIRPFNADGKKDGNFNYIHQQYVLDLFFKLRNQNAVLTSAMHSDGDKPGQFNVKLKTSELSKWKSTSKF